MTISVVLLCAGSFLAGTSLALFLRRPIQPHELSLDEAAYRRHIAKLEATNARLTGENLHLRARLAIYSGRPLQ